MDVLRPSNWYTLRIRNKYDTVLKSFVLS
jgi:hypothetical protein